MKRTNAINAISTLACLVLMAGCASTPKAAPEIPCINNPDPEGEIVLLDSFEEGNFWQAVGDTWDQWGSHNLSLETDLSEEWASDGATSGIWEFDVMSKDTSMQATFPCYALLETDWTPYKAIVVDFNNISEQPLQVNVAVQDGIEWKWTTTETFTLGKGENKNVIFSLTEGIESDGNPVTEIVHGEQLSCGMIQVVGENTGGKIMVDNIRLIKKD